MSKRVLLAGLFHETHTFLEGVTELQDFSIRRGQELLDASGDGSPLAGVVEVATDFGWDVIPTIDARATPSATVSDEAFEWFWNQFHEMSAEELVSGQLDGICLVLHGAMACESIRDVEGEFVRRIRKALTDTDSPTRIPICGVLDLHGNISEAFVKDTDGFVAYRCNPHTDAHQAGADGAKLLGRILTENIRPKFVWAEPRLIWPPTGTGTDNDPMRTLERMARDIESADADIAHVNVFGGFAFADTQDTGVSFSAVTFGDEDAARDQLGQLCDWTQQHGDAGFVTDMPLESAMPLVIQDIKAGKTPVILVEPSDNIGGGAPGDGTSLLLAFIEHEVAGSIVVINDPIAVEKLQDANLGETITLAIGGRGSQLTDGPIELEVELLSRSDGRFQLEDRHSHLASMMGVNVDMGPSAVVSYQDIQILLTSNKTPPFDLGQLRTQGLVPESATAIAVKAAVAHRRAYDPITGSTYTVDTHGPCSSNLSRFDFQLAQRRSC